MAANALYFPHIEVPNSAWFCRVLLYWDRVATIIPQDVLLRRPEALTPFTRQLLREGALEALLPLNYIRHIHEFGREFLVFVDNDPALQSRMQRGIDDLPVWPIHFEKLADVGDELVRRGLAREARAGWFEVERYAADGFMTYLATAIGALDANQYSPITNSSANLQVFAPDQHRDLLRIDLMESLLPGPESEIPIPELLRFKDRYFPMMESFRLKVEYELSLIAGIADEGARAYAAQRLKDQLSYEIDDIVSTMRTANWKRLVFGNVASLAISLTGIGVGALGPDAAVIGGGLAGAVYNFLARQAGDFGQPTSPLAYAAHARLALSSS